MRGTSLFGDEAPHLRRERCETPKWRLAVHGALRGFLQFSKKIPYLSLPLQVTFYIKKGAPLKRHGEGSNGESLSGGAHDRREDVRCNTERN